MNKENEEEEEEEEKQREKLFVLYTYPFDMRKSSDLYGGYHLVYFLKICTYHFSTVGMTRMLYTTTFHRSPPKNYNKPHKIYYNYIIFFGMFMCKGKCVCLITPMHILFRFDVNDGGGFMEWKSSSIRVFCLFICCQHHSQKRNPSTEWYIECVLLLL